MESKDVVLALAALAHAARLELFRALVVAGPSGMTPGVMAQGAGLPPATLSFHLKELSHAGLVVAERQGRHLIYRVQFDRMQQVLTYLTQNCCGGTPCAVPESSCAC